MDTWLTEDPHADGASQLPVWGGAAKGPGVELPVALPSELLREDDLDAPLVCVGECGRAGLLRAHLR
eukprot:357736-Chlamydomonas_euryale.AAC.1